MFNKVVLIGNLTRDIEMRYGQSGTAIGSSAIAVTRKFSVNGEKREETCFVDITFFGRQAEVANQYLSKGSKLLVEGRLKFDQWTDQNGQNRSKHSVQIENMEMLGNNQNGANNFTPNNYAETQSYDPYTNENSKKPAQKTPNQNQEKIREIDVDAYDSDDSDLPF
ncbi:single-stranded DNA-binding protein [Campylobacter vulpis]|uniref:Single-stranded DNA-binding protein n=1 Tax=Campylobacter vulpis TaxID=1655500 RepID=A0A2G4R0Y0_9BACT|nr:single-stranded DNA-binding protein [Campylobacter vulpis]MBS4236108.1 single-stranded DNA-binding protein [Campylobacter vulpis]MBS4241487.1 single-stranded DNA-binding protein [Campylobacter vulpis]MBS4253074.1 single-stranded DNA-binding protein [Campylobacter vulpis]MBS4269662.1 single-stranded DNA-binding protein [Campylobacter vulpis]MBS4275934.1 single-stranded DNA-binding protein [Campylobacter vulpis]